MTETHSRSILGLDPGTLKFGAALVVFQSHDLRPRIVRFCVFRPVASKPRHERYAMIAAHLEGFIRMDPMPAHAALEGGYVGKNGQTSLFIAEGRGVGMTMCGMAGLDLSIIAPMAGKRAAAGNGNADKDSVGDALLSLCEFPDGVSSLPEDAADAVSVALAAAIELRWWRRPARLEVNAPRRRRKRATSVAEFIRAATANLNDQCGG